MLESPPPPPPSPAHQLIWDLRTLAVLQKKKCRSPPPPLISFFGTCATFWAGGSPKKKCVPPIIRFGLAPMLLLLIIRYDLNWIHLAFTIIPLGAWQDRVNACIALPGTHRSAKRMLLKSYVNLSIVLFVKISHQARFCLQIYPAIFKSWVLSFTSFCRAQVKLLHCQFSCQANMLKSFCQPNDTVNVIYMYIHW